MKILNSIIVLSMLSVASLTMAATLQCPAPGTAGVPEGFIGTGTLSALNGVAIVPDPANGQQRVTCTYYVPGGSSQSGVDYPGSNIVPTGSGWVQGPLGPQCSGPFTADTYSASTCTFSVN